MNSRLLALLVAFVFPVLLFAETEGEDAMSLQRPVVGSYRVEVGRTGAYSTYLSPFSYWGTNFGISGQWTKVLPRNPRHLAMRFGTRLNFGRLLNPAGSASELDVHGHLLWGLEWQKRLASGWMIGAGGTVGAYGGLLYLLRNSNNPVSAQFAAGIGVSGFVSRVFRVGRLPLLVADRLDIPLLGGFFCQEYGESFYEIYLGNRRNLAHFGWPGNRPGVDNLLSVTLDFGRTAMEVGYRFSMQYERANNLTTRFISHAFVIGVIPGGLGIKSKKKDIITPLY